MDFELHFTFRKQAYSCMAYVDATAEPCYVFVQLKDKVLIEEFGEEVTVKTDFEKRLPKKDDHGELTNLRQALFDALQNHPQFTGAKRQYYFATTLNSSKNSIGKYHQR